jgi:hypothetical protein
MLRMLRTGAALALAGSALAGCSGALPNWVSSSPSTPPSTPPSQPLQFESMPAGAHVSTAQGQTCQTPCTLTVPTVNQAIFFTKYGFTPAMVQIVVGEPAKHTFLESAPPPALTPNPVTVTLRAVPPTHSHNNGSVGDRCRVEVMPAPLPGAAPPVAQPAASPFAPPPQQGWYPR